MILTIIGIYLLIGVIICYIIFGSKKITEGIGERGVFVNDEHLWIILALLVIFIMILWLPIILWGLVDLIIGIFYFEEGRK